MIVELSKWASESVQMPKNLQQANEEQLIHR